MQKLILRTALLGALLVAAFACQKNQEEPLALVAEDSEMISFRDYTEQELYDILDALENNINAWVSAGELNVSASFALLGKIRTMRRQVDRGRLSSAENMLNGSFMSLIASLHSFGQLTDDQFQVLDDTANGILCDAQGYATVELNGQTWLAENLNIEVLPGSWCYDNDPANCDTYGRLYTLAAAQTACAQLGDCWRVPTKAEWDAMVQQYDANWDMGDAYANSPDAYAALISGGVSGFDAISGGWRNSSGNFSAIGQTSDYWSETAFGYGLYSGAGKLFRYNAGVNSLAGISCRCVKD